MIVYDVATKVLDTESFPQHNIAGLISGITFVVIISQEKPLRWKEINTHTPAQTHPHTHAYENMYLISARRENLYTFFVFKSLGT